MSTDRALPTADDILATYDAVAQGYARARDKTLFERRWLDRALDHAPGRDVLDLGCGTGQPIATYLADRRCAVTGVDGSEAMLALFRAALPDAVAIHADMRGLDLGRRYDVMLAWNSFFHLSPADQRAMFPVFATHAAPRGVLLFTTGSGEGEAYGEVDGAPVYHASLAPAEYERLLDGAGFDVADCRLEDPDCRGHSVWLARRRG